MRKGLALMISFIVLILSLVLLSGCAATPQQVEEIRSERIPGRNHVVIRVVQQSAPDSAEYVPCTTPLKVRLLNRVSSTGYYDETKVLGSFEEPNLVYFLNLKPGVSYSLTVELRPGAYEGATVIGGRPDEVQEVTVKIPYESLKFIQ